MRASLDVQPRALDPERLMVHVDEAVDEGIRRSELRQRERLQARFADWSGEMETRRRLDLARMAAGLSYLDGQQGRQLSRTNELMGYVLEAAADEK